MANLLWPLKKSITRIVQGYGESWSANEQKQHTSAGDPGFGIVGPKTKVKLNQIW